MGTFVELRSQTLILRSNTPGRIVRLCAIGFAIAAVAAAGSTALAGAGQKAAGTSGRDPAEPLASHPAPRRIARVAGAIKRHNVSEEDLRLTVQQLVACGTRSSISSWSDPNRGIGCARDHIVARLKSIAQATGGRLQVSVDRFQATSPRTFSKPAPLENVIALLPGADPQLARTVFVVSGHFDSMPSDVMDAKSDAPGADDDASGTAVSMECARLLAHGKYRATLVFAAVSGEEQGLLGGKRLLQYFEENGYRVGGFLDNDIVGADFAPGAPHRVRVFSGTGKIEDGDSPSRELARSVEEIDGRSAIRMIFRVDRLGRGGDHYPFVMAGLPAVRFTEPLENYHHEHQTPRTENGVVYGDLIQFLNFQFIGNVARDNAEALRELALAPSPPQNVEISGGVSPDAKISWTADDDPARQGFEILWRETTNPCWTVFEFASQPGTAVLKTVATDNHFFAVRSVGKNGARSVAVPAVIAHRR